MAVSRWILALSREPATADDGYVTLPVALAAPVPLCYAPSPPAEKLPVSFSTNSA